MNKQRKSSFLLASIMAMTFAVPGVWAGGGRFDTGGHDYGHQKKGQHNSHYTIHYNTQHTNDYRGGRYYYPPYRGYRSCSNHKSHHDNHHNDHGKRWIGLPWGGIAGYTPGTIHSGY